MGSPLELDIDAIEREIREFYTIERERGRAPSEQHPCSHAVALIAEVRKLRANMSEIVVVGNSQNHDHSICHLIAATSAMNFDEPPMRSRWIPVTERLPEVNVKVLIYTERYNTHTARLLADRENGRDDYWNGEATAYDSSRVTHWQLLPQPPKEQP